jgi:DNA segregation ATPase FtsK/SpoIIIE-like protein
MGLLLSLILLPIRLIVELIEIAAKSTRRRQPRARRKAASAPRSARPVPHQTSRKASIVGQVDPISGRPGGGPFADINSAGLEWASFDHADTTAMVLAVAEYVLSTQYASAAMLQRKLKISYRDAEESLDVLEMIHAVGPLRLGKPRDVLIPAVATKVALDFIRDGVEISREGPPIDI